MVVLRLRAVPSCDQKGFAQDKGVISEPLCPGGAGADAGEQTLGGGRRIVPAHLLLLPLGCPPGQRQSCLCSRMCTKLTIIEWSRTSRLLMNSLYRAAACLKSHEIDVFGYYPMVLLIVN